MILDTLTEADRYAVLHPLFARAFEFLRKGGIEGLPDGRHEIVGDALYVMIARKHGLLRDKAVLEAHRRYIDIQYVFEGIDSIGWKSTRECRSVKKAYSHGDDCELFDDRPAGWNMVGPGSFAIFFPADAHAPMVSGGFLHKAVVKVAIHEA
jgi:YhcH/YjgK/YiaL family protein